MGNTSGLPLMGAVFSHPVLDAAHLPARSAVIQAPKEDLVAGLPGSHPCWPCGPGSWTGGGMPPRGA
ncbi:hypothetical protein DFAR_1540062 [Desulfarculales bacterium]